MRIVVVEDEDNTRDGIVRLIRKIDSRYEVVGEADNGEDGIRMIENERPDLVFADIKMPRVTGIEMLECLKERGYRHKTVILTGFSEFEYARKAVQLGVFEFLEKPITARDIKATLEKIERELAFERLAGIPVGDPAAHAEQLLVRLVIRPDSDPSLIAQHVERVYGFTAGRPIHLLSCYMGISFEEGRNPARAALDAILGPVGKHAMFELPSECSLVALLQCREEGFDFEAFLNGEAMRAFRLQQWHPVLCWGTAHHFDEVKGRFEQLRTIRKWAIIKGDDVPLHELAIANTPSKMLQYPAALENKMAASVSEANTEEIMRCFSRWQEVWLNGDYHPRHVIDACVRFVSSAFRIVGDVYGHDVSYALQNEWLSPVMEAQTRKELTDAMAMIALRIAAVGRSSQTAASYSLTVQKAMRMIQDHYQDGITLEEIASSLHITPEYLSSLITKEVNKTYSAIMKDIRIKKAKELLVHSDLKTFEIARKAGYPDAKYFSRVFKETTGLSPGEYQRLHKQAGRSLD